MGMQGKGRMYVRGTAPDLGTVANAKNLDTTVISTSPRKAQRLHQQPSQPYIIPHLHIHPHSHLHQHADTDPPCLADSTSGIETCDHVVFSANTCNVYNAI